MTGDPPRTHPAQYRRRAAQPLTIDARDAAPDVTPAHHRASVRPRWHQLLVWSLLLPCVSGCTNLSRSAVDSARLSMHRHARVDPTAAEVAAKPYFQLQATGPQGSAVLILGNVDGQRQAWYGTHQTVLFLEHGRVVETTGLGQNLDGVQLPADDPFARGLQHLAAPLAYHYRVDWSPGYRYGVQVDARLIPAGRERIDILGTAHEVLRVDEQLSAPAAHWHALNHYWVDPRDGFVWKSQQQVAPGLSLRLLELRPYRKPAP